MYLSGKGGENLNFMPQFFAAKEREHAIYAMCLDYEGGRKFGCAFLWQRRCGSEEEGEAWKSPVYCMFLNREGERIPWFTSCA